MDLELLTQAGYQLNTVASNWGAFKHPVTNEWALPWDEERAMYAELLPDQINYINDKVQQGLVKEFNHMVTGGWMPNISGDGMISLD
jgi:hypothetical protein